MKVALLGLLQSGKSTLFSAISGKAIHTLGSTAIEEAIVSVPDERIDWLAGHHKPKKVVYATIDCLDVPGFNLADEHGRAAARRLIGGIRTVDLLVLVVRAFENPSVPPYGGSVNPARDLEELKTELLLSDLELVEVRIERLEKQLHKPAHTHSQDKAELALYKRLAETIEKEKPISAAIENESELEMVKSLGFLTLKPMVVAVNVGEGYVGQGSDLGDRLDKSVPVIEICAELDYELSQLDEKSKKEFMTEMGIKETAIGKFVRSCYSALGLISFITVVHDELHAWPIKQGTVALDAAGKVHSDIQRGFIRAETFNFEQLKQYGDEKALKAAGKVKLEGKEYIVKDGDVINFRFNV
jgi:GTP-binding protein YchF